MSWTEQRLLDLITDQAQETHELEFKACDALQKSDGKKAEVSKDVSAMANAGGGTIIYGLIERNHVADSLDSGYDQNIISKEWLEQVINSNIHPRVEGLKIHAIPLSSNVGRVAYVVEVPQAVHRAPHQASDKRYHKRSNTTIQAMEDYEIRDVLRRTRSPDLYLKPEIGHASVEGPTFGRQQLRFDLRLSLTNLSTEPSLYTLCHIFLDQRLARTVTSLYRGDPVVQGGRSYVSFNRRLMVPTDFPIMQGHDYFMGAMTCYSEEPLEPTRFHMGSSIRSAGFERVEFFAVEFHGGTRLTIEPL